MASTNPLPSPFDRAYHWFDEKWGRQWRQSLRDIPRRGDSSPQMPPERTSIRLERWDILGALVVLGCVGWLVTTFFENGQRLIGQDATVYYLPMWSYLGDRLANWEIPGWNPYQYGGSPFAADPESGWTYLPSMLLYALFSIGTATTLWLITHFVIASLGAYFYARSIALNIFGSVFTGVAYVSSTWFYRNSVSSPAYIQTGTWIPFTFLFIELAARATSWQRRLLFAGCASFTFGQIVAAWLGKGAYYSVFLLGGYVIYRTLILPPIPTETWRSRLQSLATIGIGMGFWTTLFSAAGILPRLEYHSVSNLAGGYQDHAADVGFVALADIPARILGSAPDSPTTVVAFLAAIGLVLAGRRHIGVYFGLAVAATVLLFVNEGYWLQFPFSFLPEFDTIHNHYPFQILMIAMFPFAILAGIAVSRISSWREEASRVFIALLFPFLLLWTIGFNGVILESNERRAVFLLTIVIALGGYFVLPHSLRTVAAVALIALHLWPFAQRVDYIGLKMAGGVMYTDVNEFFAPSGAVSFIQQQQIDAGAPYRFFGYDPQYGVQVGDFNVLYRRHFPIQGVVNIEVNNRATVHHLYDIQGQNNPIQIKRYVDMFTMINEGEQDYHEAAVIDTGLDSPFLDLLNVRYIIVPAAIPADRTDLNYLTSIYPTVYWDDEARVLERTNFQERAFLVPSVIPARDSQDALDFVTTNTAVMTETATVESDLVFSGSRDPNDSVSITTFDPEQIIVSTRTASNQLLVLSEIAFPGWNVYVDGERADMQTAYGAFRAVEVPAGEHTVEFVFESRTLQIGTIISAIGYSLFIVFLGYVLIQEFRHRRAE